jgi:phenylacetate-CoA ligase
MATAAERPSQLLTLRNHILERSYWDPARMRAWQFAQLQPLLAHSERTMVFWRNRLREADIRTDAPLTAEGWARLPVLTRAQAQVLGTTLHCLSVPPQHGATITSSTSGSTGRPLRVIRTEAHQLCWRAICLHDTLWHGQDLNGVFVAVRTDHGVDPGPRLGRRFPNWGEEFAGEFTTGPASLFHVGKPVADQAAWLVRENPHYVLSFGSNLELLLRHFRTSGQKLRRLRALRSFAEVVSPEMRELAREVFGVGIIDAYSAEEVGYIALQCPAHEHLHVMSDSVYLEVLDDAGNPCRPGEVGRVIVTPLHNYAMPLLRYELGDYAEVGGACPCGCTLPVLRRILGRVRHRVVMPDGERRFVRFGGRRLNAMRVIRQYQLVQTTRTDMVLNLATHRPLTAEEEAEIVDIITSALGHPFNIRINPVIEIPRAPSGKFEDFRSEAE